MDESADWLTGRTEGMWRVRQQKWGGPLAAQAAHSASIKKLQAFTIRLREQREHEMIHKAQTY